MRARRTFRLPGTFLCLLLLCSCATEDSFYPPRPADVTMNAEAGRKDFLYLTLRLENGEQLPFVLDTGTSRTLFAKSLEPKLGKRLGTELLWGWGKKTNASIYAAPKLYLGNTPLRMGSTVCTADLTRLSKEVGHPVAGILGMDCLWHYCLQLDFAAGKIRFLDPGHEDAANMGTVYPIIFSHSGRPDIHHQRLTGGPKVNLLVDSGFDGDGAWASGPFGELREQQLLNASGTATAVASGRLYFPKCIWDGETYTNIVIGGGGDLIGLRFLTRHLVTLDFPKRRMYLKRQSVGPLSDEWLPFLKTTPMEVLNPVIKAVLHEDANAARLALARIEQSNAPALVKTVARKLVATLEETPKPSPADMPPQITQLSLGDARPELAKVGWLKPAANRIPPNDEIESPLLDSGKIYATGLFAHSPSRYVYDLGGKWPTLCGQAGLHTAYQPYGSVVFIIKADGKEVFRSKVIRGQAKASYDIDVTGVKTLELIVDKAGDRNGGNWALWLDPTLFREPPKDAKKDP
jgi:NPCBM/NEW2 domain